MQLTSVVILVMVIFFPVSTYAREFIHRLLIFDTLVKFLNPFIDRESRESHLSTDPDNELGGKTM